MRIAFLEHYEYDFFEMSNIESYCDQVMMNIELENADLHDAARSRLLYFFDLFNRNLKYCNFSIILFQNTLANTEPELHTSRRKD